MREISGKFSWDDDTNQTNIEKHGISFQRAAIALDEGRPIEAQRTDDSGRYDALVQLNGDTFRVVYEKNGEDIQIITAHKGREGGRKFDDIYDEKVLEQGIEKKTEFNQKFATWRELDKAQQREARPYVKALEQKQEAEKKAVLSVECSQDEKEKLKAELKARHRQEAIEDRKPRLEHDSKERTELAAELQKRKEQSKAIDGQIKQGHQKSSAPQETPEWKKKMMEDLAQNSPPDPPPRPLEEKQKTKGHSK